LAQLSSSSIWNTNRHRYIPKPEWCQMFDLYSYCGWMVSLI